MSNVAALVSDLAALVSDFAALVSDFAALVSDFAPLWHPIPWLFAAWLGFVAAQRICELILSRRHVRRRHVSMHAPDHAPDHAPLHTPLSTAEDRAGWSVMIAVHAALIVVPAIEVSLFERRAPAWFAWTAFALFVGAQVLRYAAIRALGVAWNARGVVDRALVVVDRGPYRFIRHPNYVAVILEFTAVPLGGGAWISWVVLNGVHAFVLARRIHGEEALLFEVPGYRERMAAKRRFWPTLDRLWS